MTWSRARPSWACRSRSISRSCSRALQAARAQLGPRRAVTAAGAAPMDAGQSVTSAINRAAGGRPIPGNQVRLLIDGPEAYEAMLDVIARRHPLDPLRELHHPGDAAGRRFAEALWPGVRARACTSACLRRPGLLGTPRSLLAVPPRGRNRGPRRSARFARWTWCPICHAITGSWSWPTERAP